MRSLILFIIFFVVGLLLFRSIGINPIAIWLMLSLAAYSSGLPFRAALKAHLTGLTAGFFIVVLMSLIGYLPKSGYDSTVLFSGYANVVYMYGFTHPNFFFAVIMFAYFELNWLYENYFKKTRFIAGILLGLFAIGAGAYTAGVGFILASFFILYPLSLRKGGFKRIVSFGSILVVLFVALIILIVTSNPSGAFAVWMNGAVQSRPYLWNYYLDTYRVEAIAKPIELNLSGFNTTPGNGALDGGIIYNLMYFGIIPTILIVWTWLKLRLQAIRTNDFVLLIFFTLMVTMTLSENTSSEFYTNGFMLFVGYGVMKKGKTSDAS